MGNAAAMAAPLERFNPQGTSSVFDPSVAIGTAAMRVGRFGDVRPHRLHIGLADVTGVQNLVPRIAGRLDSALDSVVAVQPVFPDVQDRPAPSPF